MKKSFLSRIGILALFFAVFLFFFNGYYQSGPSRSKFKKLPGGTEDVAADEIKPETEDKLLKELAAERRLKDWTAFWQKCIAGFTVGSMESAGESQIESDPVDINLVKEDRNGPGKMFYTAAPGGQYINPYWKRLVYKKESEGWTPYIELPCSAMLYDSKNNSARIVLTCTMFEGIHEAIWLNKNRLLLLGYESVSRQMDVSCETVETCAAPAIWVLDFDKNSMRSYRGDIINRSGCDLDSYLKKILPNFFGKK